MMVVVVAGIAYDYTENLCGMNRSRDDMDSSLKSYNSDVGGGAVSD